MELGIQIEQKEQKTLLGLSSEHAGGIYVTALSPDGSKWNLVFFSNEGTIRLCHGVRAAGFQVGYNSCIRLID